MNVIRAEVVKWQTRYVQVVVLARACGFKSRLRHPLNKRGGLLNR
jgi:hypothetical protein